jgi:NADH-quinone oxidoreductase subunit M
VPFLFFLLNKLPLDYNIPHTTIDNLGYLNVSRKGVGQAIVLLLWYGILSGIVLYLGYYKLYDWSGTSNIYVAKACLVDDWECNVALWLIFMSGGIKVSLIPFHIWLSKVHVEASTVGSVLLAGVALKSGFYIHLMFWREFIFVVISGVEDGLGMVSFYTTFFILGSLVVSLSLFFQVDSKRWIALYSISHMQIFYIILLNTNTTLITSTIFYGMIGHSIISGGLFFVVGFIVDWTANRNIKEINSALYGTNKELFYFFIASNAGFPLLGLFVTEIMNFSLFCNYNCMLGVCCILLNGLGFISGYFITYKGVTNVRYFLFIDCFILNFVMIILCLCSISMGIQISFPISLFGFINY